MNGKPKRKAAKSATDHGLNIERTKVRCYLRETLNSFSAILSLSSVGWVGVTIKKQSLQSSHYSLRASPIFF